ncbi:MAG: DISARM system helicase DrmA [Propionibacteriaceae bacterium]|jgi:hypothetical protein|nr:DISARM system helicase DrmA [Propionibacteriaceae bacterium]
MTETVTPPTAPGYQLGYPLDGTSYAVRENFVDILGRELVGPMNGSEEVVLLSPRQLYLAGYLAPVKVVETSAETETETGRDDDGNLVEMLADPGARAAGRGVPVAIVDSSDADDEDDDAEDRAPKSGLMAASSMGLRFQIGMDVESFQVTASWGLYESVATDKISKSGHPIRHYKRTPIEEPRTIKVADLQLGVTKTVPLRDAAVLRIDRYDDAEHGRRLIEIALCNDRETPLPIPLGMWMWQTGMRVDAWGAEVFLPVRDMLEQDWQEHDEEVRRLNLQYRDRLEFAVGRTCSVDWVVKAGSRRATEVSTTWVPTAETPQTLAGSVEGALLSMDALSAADAQAVKAGLAPLVDGYGAWLDVQESAAKNLPPWLAETADLALWEARRAHQRLVDGLEFLGSDVEALRCFQFMNRVMRDQRVASQVAGERAGNPSVSIQQARDQVLTDSSGNQVAAWRPFQLAFILMQLRALTDPAATLRSAEHQAQVELLFFPTGGGKTEAYLGLAAYTFAIRRRQGVIKLADDSLDGLDGVSVLMRYTLRLLTAQQFQRATALVCAAELARREDEAMWGSTPFRIGLWVGTDVSPKQFEEAKEQLDRVNDHGGYRLPVLQIKRCPWCGTPITPAQVKTDKTMRRVYVYCGDDLARCPFSKGGGIVEGLPVLTVDEEIYRLTPVFVIATVDKFARLAREGHAASLFGYVSKKCGRHGYVHPDYLGCTITTQHQAEDGHPKATITPVKRLRPPDLIIQDELHLITGALGTSVGLFEVAVETLCSWEASDGQPVRPLIVASTATVRNAREQVRGLYGRAVSIFPPQVLDVADTYFSREMPVNRDHPGRRYVGISAYGVRLTAAEIRVAETLLESGQLLFDQVGAVADPYMTLVGYFNATRELAGMRRFIDDDVSSRVKRPRLGSGFSPRRGAFPNGILGVEELTSRNDSDRIANVLNLLGLAFDPDYDTTTAYQDRMARIKAKEKVPQRKEKDSPFDVVLATSMLQVGVDVPRLGLMLVVGQPKNTAEYIQASSRVGRDTGRGVERDKPGLVVTLANWARPRDLVHFEQFRHYHDTFYAQVEALSVTPYSPTSLERGIDGLLVSTVRVLQAPLDYGLSPERNAGRIAAQHDVIAKAVERLKARIATAALDDKATRQASDALANRLDRWAERARHAAAMSQALVYERVGGTGQFLSLIVSPENLRAASGMGDRAPFVVANSMREVQPEINVLVSPLPDRMFTSTPGGVAGWTLPAEGDD